MKRAARRGSNRQGCSSSTRFRRGSKTMSISCRDTGTSVALAKLPGEGSRHHLHQLPFGCLLATDRIPNRPTSGSAWASFVSLLHLNNQTVNTYSHLIGAFMFLMLPFHFYNDFYLQQANGQLIDVLVVSTYCLGVAICFVFSTM